MMTNAQVALMAAATLQTGVTRSVGDTLGRAEQMKQWLDRQDAPPPPPAAPATRKIENMDFPG